MEIQPLKPISDEAGISQGLRIGNKTHDHKLNPNWFLAYSLQENPGSQIS